MSNQHPENSGPEERPNDAKLAVRPLIIGGTGLVGGALVDDLETIYPHTVSATRVELDLTDRWRVEHEIERLESNVVINAAAVSNVDLCEKDPELADAVNHRAVAYLARACKNVGARLIHFSTDYVFDGEKGSEYEETDPVNPINEYGRSKLRGEVAALEGLIDVCVLRVSFVFGAGRPTFLDWIAGKAIADKEPLPIVDSWTNRATSTNEINRVVRRILETDASGLWHVAGPPAVTRAQFARGIFELLGEDPNRVTPVDASTLDLAAKRPQATPLSTKLFETQFDYSFRPWTEWAAEYLAHHPPNKANS